MSFRHLTISAACAALLGLLASSLVRVYVTDLMAMGGSAPVSGLPVGSLPDPGPPRPDGESSTFSTAVASTPESEATPVPPSATPLHPGTSKRLSCRKPTHGLADELGRGIRRLGDRRYEIKRATLELALGNLPLLSQWVRAAPELGAGKAVGFRLWAIRADGPFAKLGLENDDVLVSINGLDLSSPDNVLSAYGKLKGAKQLRLGLVRDGSRIEHGYTIR